MKKIVLLMLWICCCILFVGCVDNTESSAQMAIATTAPVTETATTSSEAQQIQFVVKNAGFIEKTADDENGGVLVASDLISDLDELEVTRTYYHYMEIEVYALTDNPEGTSYSNTVELEISYSLNLNVSFAERSGTAFDGLPDIDASSTGTKGLEIKVPTSTSDDPTTIFIKLQLDPIKVSTGNQLEYTLKAPTDGTVERIGADVYEKSTLDIIAYQLATPTVTYDSTSGALSWGIEESVAYYVVYFDGSVLFDNGGLEYKIQNDNTDKTYTVENIGSGDTEFNAYLILDDSYTSRNYSFSVKAFGDDANVENSDMSNGVNIFVRVYRGDLDSPGLSVSGTSIEWDNIDNVEYYQFSLDGEEILGADGLPVKYIPSGDESVITINNVSEYFNEYLKDTVDSSLEYVYSSDYYSFTVKAISISDDYGDSQSASVKVYITIEREAVAEVLLEKVDTSTFSFKQVENADYYEVYINEALLWNNSSSTYKIMPSGDGGYIQIDLNDGLNEIAQYSVNGMTSAAAEIQLVACSYDSDRASSEKSNTVSLKMDMRLATPVVAVNSGYSEQIKFAKIGEADYYRLYISNKELDINVEQGNGYSLDDNNYVIIDLDNININSALIDAGYVSGTYDIKVVAYSNSEYYSESNESNSVTTKIVVDRGTLYAPTLDTDNKTYIDVYMTDNSNGIDIYIKTDSSWEWIGVIKTGVSSTYTITQDYFEEFINSGKIAYGTSFDVGISAYSDDEGYSDSSKATVKFTVEN